MCHAPEGAIDFDALREKAAGWPGLKNMDLAHEVTCDNAHMIGGKALGRWSNPTTAKQRVNIKS